MADNPFALPDGLNVPGVYSPETGELLGFVVTRQMWEGITAAMEQHGIMNVNSTVDTPHPDQRVLTLGFGGGRGILDQDGLRLTYPNSIYWGVRLADPVPTYPYAKITSDAGLAYPGTTITFDAESHVDASNHVLVRQSVDPSIGGSFILWEIESGGTTETMVFSRGGVGSNGLTVNADVYAAEKLSIGSFTELTIATGVITVTSGAHTVDTQSDAASDDLDTISGGITGQILVLSAANSGRTVVCKDGTGNLKLAGDMSLDSAEDTICLIYNGASWLEVSRSDNGA